MKKVIIYENCMKILKILTKIVGKTRENCENGKLWHDLILYVIRNQKSIKKSKKKIVVGGIWTEEGWVFEKSTF